MENVILAIENHRHRESFVCGVFTTSQKAWEYIGRMEKANEDNSVSYEIQNWKVDCLCE